jgi:hypothetical protein
LKLSEDSWEIFAIKVALDAAFENRATTTDTGEGESTELDIIISAEYPEVFKEP